MNISIFTDRMTPSEASEALGVTVDTLSVWRSTRRYPLPFVKIGGKVFYRGEDLKKFIEKRTFCKNTEET